MRRTIPQIRARLVELAAEHGIPELAELAEETKRRFGGRRAKVASETVPAAKKDAIRAYAAAYPDASYGAIASHFNVNIGRVSEALTGHRGKP